MKPRTVVLLILLLVSACSPHSGEDLERNKQLVRDFTAVTNAGDWPALETILVENFARHSEATAGPPVRTRDQFIALQQGFLQAMPDQRVEIKQLVAEGDRVAALATYSGTLTGPMGDFPATGRAAKVPFLALFRIESNHIAELWVEWDNVSMLTQLGLFPAPPPDAEKPGSDGPS